jgi:hypothetical protein
VSLYTPKKKKKANRWRRVISPPILNLGTRWRWLTSRSSRFPLGNNPNTYLIRSCVRTGAGLERRQTPSPHSDFYQCFHFVFFRICTFVFIVPARFFPFTVQHTQHTHPRPWRDFFRFCILLYSVLHPYLCLCLDYPAFCFICLYSHHTTQTSVPPAEFEPAIPLNERP